MYIHRCEARLSPFYTESLVLVASWSRGGPWVSKLCGAMHKEPDSASSTLSLWAVWSCLSTPSLWAVWSHVLNLVWRAVWRVTLSSPIPSLWAVYISVQGRLSKSLLSWWRRLSCLYTELPCCVYIGGGVRLSNLCWVIVAAAQQTLAELVEGVLRSSSSANPCCVGGRGLTSNCQAARARLRAVALLSQLVVCWTLSGAIH